MVVSLSGAVVCWSFVFGQFSRIHSWMQRGLQARGPPPLVSARMVGMEKGLCGKEWDKSYPDTRISPSASLFLFSSINALSSIRLEVVYSR
jgi:hypothetical protein